MSYKYSISLAGIPLCLSCRYSYRSFYDFLTVEKPLKVVHGESAEDPDEYLTEKEKAPLKEAELSRLIGRIGSALLEYDRCIFHGEAFVWHEKAWIFTDPSGGGKTAPYIRWKERFGKELSILNGDKPILEFGEDDSVTVHLFPWKGEECMGTEQAAPLGGILCLQQGTENRSERLKVAEAAVRLQHRFIYDDTLSGQVDRVWDMEKRMLRRYPVWELTNCGDPAPAELMRDTVSAWEIGGKPQAGSMDIL